jgi:hypothetical protein
VQNDAEIEQLDVTDAASIRSAVGSTLSQTGNTRAGLTRSTCYRRTLALVIEGSNDGACQLQPREANERLASSVATKDWA